MLQNCPSRACALTRGVLAVTTLAVLAPAALSQLQFDELRKRNLPPRPRNIMRHPAQKLRVVPALFGHGDRDRALVHIQTDETGNPAHGSASSCGQALLLIDLAAG